MRPHDAAPSARTGAGWFRFAAPQAFYPLAGRLVPVFGTGAAVFRRGGATLAVFDSSDLRNVEALLRYTAGAVEVRTFPKGLVLVLSAGSASAPGLTRGPAGWVLGPSRPSPSGAEAAEALGTGTGPAPGLTIGGVPPNRVVVIRDPESDLPLLVGTTREAGRASAGGRRAPGDGRRRGRRPEERLLVLRIQEEAPARRERARP